MKQQMATHIIGYRHVALFNRMTPTSYLIQLG